MSNKVFIHFVGGSYYTQHTFSTEAVAQGVSRRISINQMKQMDFGDRIVLCIKDGKSAKVFGEFTVSTIAGVSSEGMDLLRQAGLAIAKTAGTSSIQRKCGAYTIVATYSIMGATLPQIAAILEKANDAGKVMVAGQFLAHPEFRMTDLPHSRGFRLLNYTKIMNDVIFEQAKIAAATGKAKLPAVRGCYYVQDKPVSSGTLIGAVAEVDVYNKATQGRKRRKVTRKKATDTVALAA